MASNSPMFTYAEIARRANGGQITKTQNVTMPPKPVSVLQRDAARDAVEQAWKRFNSKQMEKHQNIGTYAHSLEVACQEINNANNLCATKTTGCTEHAAVTKLLHSLTPAFDSMKIQYDNYFKNKKMPSWNRTLHQLLEFERGLIVRADKRFPITKLPRELRDCVYSMMLQERLEVSVSKYTPGFDPDPVATVTQIGGQRSRLEFVRPLLKEAVFMVTTPEECKDLQHWLASIDFTPLQTIDGVALNDGFDLVRTLKFSDINFIERHRIQTDDPTKFEWKTVTEEPSQWKNNIALMRKCKNLTTVELDLVLGSILIEGLQETQDVDRLFKNGIIGKHQVEKVLKLRGLKVIHLHFFNSVWQSTCLTRKQEQKLIDWLTAEFQKLGETTYIMPEWVFWAQDWS